MASEKAQHKKVSVRRENFDLLLSFPYDKKKYAAARKIGGFYDKKAKCWRLTLADLPKLVRSPLFGPSKASYHFKIEELTPVLQHYQECLEEAKKQVQSNPFHVSKEAIDLL